MWDDLTEFEKTIAKIAGGFLLLMVAWTAYVISFLL
jgi:hypothetical protein